MNNNNWYIIPNFLFNYKEHLKVFELFLNNKYKILIKKDIVDFNKLDINIQEEIIEENFYLYINKILYFESKKVEQEIEISIRNNLFKKYGNKNNLDIDNQKDILLEKFFYNFSNIDKDTLYNIKLIITEKLNTSNFKSNIFKNIQDISFKTIFYHMENKNAKFAWYEIKNKEELIKEFNIDYNIILTKDLTNFYNFDYYFNFIEEEQFILAINDNKGDFKNLYVPLIKEIFNCKYDIFLFKNSHKLENL